MRFAITMGKLAAICIAGAAAAVALSLLGRLILAAFALCPALLAYSMMSKRKKALPLGDLSIFVSNLMLNYSDGKSTITIIKESLDRRFLFYKDVQAAIRAYTMSGNAREAFAWAASYASPLYREVFFALAESLESGASIIGPIREIAKSISATEGLNARSIGSMANAMSIVNLGSVIFFPVFAGISYYIMGFSAGISGAAPLGQIAYMFIIVFYIAEISIYNNFNSAHMGFSAGSIAASIAIGSFLFKASYLFALNGIRW
ncbi:MAG: hypothetical protein QXR73_03745 [Candidatus Micrarchaeaceae archaeon]